MIAISRSAIPNMISARPPFHAGRLAATHITTAARPGGASTYKSGNSAVSEWRNVPRGPGRPPALYVADLWAAIVAATEGWTPDLLLISAGFDAMLGDPLGGFTLEPEHYAELTHRLRERLPSAPIVGLLEGGYNPDRLADGVLAHLAALA